MSRNIIINPNRGTTGSTEQPYITFSGLTSGSINLVVEDDGSLTFDGETGSLFGISDNKDGLLHSVNDVSGLPILSVYDDDRVVIGKWDEPTLTVSGQTWNVMIGSGHTINSGVLRSAIIGGGNITGTTSDTVFTPNLMVTGNEVIQTNLSSYPIGTLTAANNKGNVVIFDHWDSIGYGAYNINQSGTSLFQFGDVSSYPSKEKFGTLLYVPTGYTRTGSPTTGDYAWGDKVVLRALKDTNGMVFNIAGPNGQRTFAWEVNGGSLMVLHANDGNPRLCVDCDPTDLEYKGDATVQIGSTGNTASFKYVDGNQQNGYVLTSDSNGNATWQASTGGGTFTGNTSGSCITDLYVSNVFGCSGNTLLGISSNIFNFTTDLGNGSESYIYGDPTYLQIGWGLKSIFFDTNVVEVQDGAGGKLTLNGVRSSLTTYNNGDYGYHVFEDNLGAWDDMSGILMKYNDWASLYTLSSSTKPQPVTIISSQSSQIGAISNNISVVGGSGHTVSGNINNSVVLGGENINVTTSNTVYVPNLNIGTLGVGSSVNNLGIDVNGNVVTGTAGGGIPEATTATTTTINFTGQTIYYNASSPGTGNITGNLTGAKLGLIQKIYHNSGTEPTYPAGWVLMGDAIYFTSTLNIIYAEWATGTRVEYWYVQEQ